MTRESMTFYADWLNAVKSLPKAMQADVLLAILEYGINGVDTCSEGSVETVILAFVKPQIDINNQRFENGKKGAEFGMLGGRPRKTPRKPQENPEETPRKPQNNPIGFSTPLSPSSLSPEPPFSTPPISPSSSTTTISAHAREWEGAELKTDPYGFDPKEKSCGQKESPLPSGIWVASEDLADRLLADSRWVQAVAKNKGHTEDEVRILVREFCTNVELTEDGKEVSDAKRHFINWLRKKIQNNGTHTQRSITSTQQRGVGGSMQSHLEAVRRAVAEGVTTTATRQEWE